MAQFNYLNEINSLMSMDGPVTRGPLQRWVKKSVDNVKLTNISIQKNTSVLNQSSNVSFQKLSISSSQSNTSGISKTPNNSKKRTPPKNKSPGRNVSTPTPNKGSKTPQNSADRFIPSRSTSNFELCHYMLNQPKPSESENSPTEGTNTEANTETTAGFRQALLDNLNIPQQQRLLQYTCKAPAAPEGYQNHLKVVYSQSKVPSSVKSTSRYIPLTPDRILDAPDIVDDYYLNLVDWSASNILTVALGSAVYLWHADTGSISQLMGVEPAEGPNGQAVGPHVTSLAWVQGSGSHLAIGTALGTTELWDTERQKRLRVMDCGPENNASEGAPLIGGAGGRVGALSWNAHVLSSGCRTGQIVHHDVRQKQHRVCTLQGHSQEVCGLKWSPDGKYLASGGNDNRLNIWQAASGEKHSLTQALYSFNVHQAAVKGLAWCPWSAGLLASGAGTADRTIRLWNVNNGTNINTIDTKSQVCSIVWSTTYRELISGHGYANNELIIWKYPTMTRVAELAGHTARVLHLALSPDGTTVLSAGADETLRLWKCFLPDPSKKKEKTEVQSAKSIFKQIIR